VFKPYNNNDNNKGEAMGTAVDFTGRMAILSPNNSVEALKE